MRERGAVEGASLRFLAMAVLAGGGRGEGLANTARKRHKFHPKTNLHTKFYPIRTIVKCSNPGEERGA